MFVVRNEDNEMNMIWENLAAPDEGAADEVEFDREALLAATGGTSSVWIANSASWIVSTSNAINAT